MEDLFLIAYIVFGLAVVCYVLIACDVRRYALRGSCMPQALLAIVGAVGTIGSLVALLTLPVAYGTRKARYQWMPIAVSALVTIALPLTLMLV